MDVIKLKRKLRIIRPVRDFLLTPNKEGMSTRSFDYLKFLVASRRRSRVFASFPSSGWNWTVDILSYAISRQCGFENPISYDSDAKSLMSAKKFAVEVFHPADSRVMGAKRLSDLISDCSIDYCLHTHGYWGESPIFRADGARHIFIIRDFSASLYSYYVKRRKQYDGFEHFLLSSGHMQRLANFYNSWNSYMRKNEGSFDVFRYEDIKKNPKAEFQRMIQTSMGLSIPEVYVDEALSYFDLEKQKKREIGFSEEGKSVFHYGARASYEDEMGQENFNTISKFLADCLDNDFGYIFRGNVPQDAVLN